MNLRRWLTVGIGVKRWRALHRLSYAIFAAATAHGIAAGSDSGRPWALALYLGAVAAVVLATAFRALTAAPRRAGRTVGP
mgnify:CR=1 FL=1